LTLLAKISSAFLGNHFSRQSAVVFVKLPANTTLHKLIAPVAE